MAWAAAPLATGMGGMLSRKALKDSPDLQKQLEIEQKDERNIAISNSAKGKAFDIMLFVYGALMLSFALMQVDLARFFCLSFATFWCWDAAFIIGSNTKKKCKKQERLLRLSCFYPFPVLSPSGPTQTLCGSAPAP